MTLRATLHKTTGSAAIKMLCGSDWLAILMTMMMTTRLVQGNHNAENTLRHALLDGYDPLVRPVTNVSQAVKVNLTFFIQYIEELDARNQLLQMILWMNTIWQDEFLTWDPTDYEGISAITVPHSQVWKPDVFFLNGFDSFLDQEPTPYSMLRVSSMGHVVRSDHGTLTSRCWIDISYFPFDVQKCDIEVQMFSSVSTQVCLDAVVVNIGQVSTEGAWKFLTRTVTVGNKTIDAGESFSQAIIRTEIARKPLVYIFFVVIPILVTSLLGLLPFCLPAESGEKVGLSITVLLSFTVFQTMLFDIMPEASSHMPLIAIHNICVLIISVISLGATVLVLRWHHRKGPVPDHLQSRLIKIANVLKVSQKFSCRCQRSEEPKGRCVKENGICAIDNKTRTEEVQEEFEDGIPEKYDDILDWVEAARILDRVFLWAFIALNAIFLLFVIGKYTVTLDL